MFNKKIILFLIIITLFSFFLRFYMVDKKPLGVQPDEASLGYNAYSILKTGKDEHGIYYPIIFKAFGDQKLPAYIYLTVPFIKFFSLNNLSIRLPAVLLGTLLSISVFFLLNQLGFPVVISFIGSLITAVSPWSIILSRLFGYESLTGLLFFVLGISFSLLTFKKNKLLYAIIAGLCFGLTWYSYISYRLITPIIITAIIIIYMREKRFINKYGIFLLLSFLIVVIPLIKLTISGKASIRFNQILSIKKLGMILEINENRSFCANYLPKIICFANSNKIESYTRNLFYRYVNTFSPDYLFLNGDKNSKYINVDNFGLFPNILIPFYFLGIVYIWNNFINRKLSKNEIFIIMGLIFSPLPALIVDEPQKVRLSALMPFIIILISLGLLQFKKYFKNKNYFKTFYKLIIISLFIYNFSFMINLLTIHIDKYEINFGTYIPKLMKYLYKQNQNTEIYIKSIPESAVLYAYVNKIDPNFFLKSIKRQKPDGIGFVHITDLGNLHITENSIEEIYCLSKNKNKNLNTLYVTNEDYVKTGKVKKANKIIWSENKVHSLAIVYNIKDINEKNINCTNNK